MNTISTLRKFSALKSSKVTRSIALASLLTVALFAATAQGQAQPPQHDPAGPPHSFPAPTNLKVLPKNLTGEQVREIMHKWASALGTQCGTCHAADPTHMGPNGKPRLNFPDDSKQAKSTARLMYKMTDEINTQYISMVENSGVPVSCGTCHRGHLDPEPFVAPPEHEGEHHEPPPSGKQPAKRH
jgi:mono/diheme cytochrome c family protein